MLFSDGSSSKKKTLIFDVEDVLFSAQYIMLQNIDDFSKQDEDLFNTFSPILDAIEGTGMSVTQAIMHRKEEVIMTHEEFENVMAYAINKGLVQDEQIMLETPYSKFMKSINIISIHAEVIFLYDNIMEKTLIEARCGNGMIEGAKFIEVDEFLKTYINVIQAGEVGIYTARTKIIDTLLEKKVPISIMYPNTLKYLKKYKEFDNCGAIQNLWTHVE